MANETELATTALALLQDPARRQQMGESARRVVEENRGALKKHMDHILAILDNR